MSDIVCFPPPPTPDLGFWAKFWEFKLSDAINSVIALMSVLMAFLVYRYQRGKDIRDYAQQNLRQAADARQAERVARQEWVQLLLLEPNREYLLNFFRELENSVQVMNQSPVLSESQIQARTALESLFNEFDRRFLTYFESIDQRVASENNELIDKLREDMINTIGAFTNEEYVPQHQKLVGLIFVGRNTFLSNLYSFSFATI